MTEGRDKMTEGHDKTAGGGSFSINGKGGVAHIPGLRLRGDTPFTQN
jgi:hypothetical protein